MDDVFEFTGVLAESGNKLWGFHVVVPDVMAQTLLANDGKRVVCTLNGKHAFQCGLIPKGEGVYCIMINKKLRETLRLNPGSSVAVSLRKDDSEYGLPVTEELSELFRQDEAGRHLFHALPPGRQRTLLYIAAQVKNPQARMMRALTIVEHLKNNDGRVNYRQLNVELKSNGEA